MSDESPDRCDICGGPHFGVDCPVDLDPAVFLHVQSQRDELLAMVERLVADCEPIDWKAESTLSDARLLIARVRG